MSRGPFAGVVGYVKLLASVRDKPTTITEFQARHGLSPTGAYSFLVCLYYMDRLHVADWRLATGVRPMPVFALGSRADMPCPKRTLSGLPTKGGVVPGRRAPPASLVAFEHLLRGLEAHPSTCTELRIATGFAHAATRHAVNALVAHDLARIGGWDVVQSACPQAEYVWGGGKPTAKPKPMPRKVTNARHWARRKERLRAEAIQRAFKEAA